MQIKILKGHSFSQETGLCCVIDVLRAFTTAAFAFSRGAREIYLVSHKEEAFAYKQENMEMLLMGEEEGVFIEGFDYENSPYQISKEDLEKKIMVQRTSSGTQGVLGCPNASHILLASFVVAEATLKRIQAIRPASVCFIATGKHDAADEDLAFAEYLAQRLQGIPVGVKIFLDRVESSPAALRIKKREKNSQKTEEDIRLAQDVDRFSFAMEVFRNKKSFIARKVYV